ncbi:integrase core domain-containing protein [Anaerosalibacter massiliensis]|uniref:integrase core domain-containing protein n=1 Tax=Anaerosalibacter massiliensis TaxID=1347392 RepID=UPI003B8455F7
MSHKFEDACKELNLEHERIPFKAPNKNAHIESFHRLLEDECLSKYEFESYTEALIFSALRRNAHKYLDLVKAQQQEL